MDLRSLPPRAKIIASTMTISLCVLTVVAAKVYPPGGPSATGLLPTLGRFHPILLHAPVTLLPLAFIMEIVAARWRPAWRETAGFVLGLGTLTVIGASVAGIMLAATGGYSGPLVDNHLRGGLITTCLAVAAWILLSRHAKLPRLGGLLALFLTQVALMWTAHIGGSLTHGEAFLTGALPNEWKDRLGIKEAVIVDDPADQADPVFVEKIRPLLRASCVECHGPNKSNGDLRVDSLAFLMKGGESGRTVVAGKANQSELMRRLLLPANDPKAMPPPGKQRYTPEQVELFRTWLDGLKPGEGAKAPVDHEAVDHFFGEVPAPTAYKLPDIATVKPQVDVFRTRTGAFIAPLSRVPTDGLALNTRICIQPFGDAELAQAASFAALVISADFTDAKFTDAALAKALPAFKNVRSLNLTRVALGPQSLAAIAKLPNIESLILVGTPVNDALLGSLKSAKSLRSLYLKDTQVTPAGIDALKKDLPACNTTNAQPSLQAKPVPADHPHQFAK